MMTKNNKNISKGAKIVDELENFDKMKIGIASDEKIREWSHGEVKSQKLLTTEH